MLQARSDITLAELQAGLTERGIGVGIGALHLGGMTAPVVIDGPMTGDWFEAYAEQVLAPSLTPGEWWSWTTSRPTRTSPPAAAARQSG